MPFGAELAGKRQMGGVRKWIGEVHRKEAGGGGKKACVKQGLKNLEHPFPGALTTPPWSPHLQPACPVYQNSAAHGGKGVVFNLFISIDSING